VIPKAEALSTRERWASVGTYSAVTLRFQSLNQYEASLNFSNGVESGYSIKPPE
jgi:hypothetical protein